MKSDMAQVGPQHHSDLWKGYEKYAGICAKCGTEGLKRNMATLSVKANSYSPMRKLCNLCPDCVARLLDFLEVSMPE